MVVLLRATVHLPWDSGCLLQGQDYPHACHLQALCPPVPLPACHPQHSTFLLQVSWGPSVSLLQVTGVGQSSPQAPSSTPLQPATHQRQHSQVPRPRPQAPPLAMPPQPTLPCLELLHRPCPQQRQAPLPQPKARAAKRRRVYGQSTKLQTDASIFTTQSPVSLSGTNLMN